LTQWATILVATIRIATMDVAIQLETVLPHLHSVDTTTRNRIMLG